MRDVSDRAVFFFLNDPATPGLSPFPLPDALPIARAFGPRLQQQASGQHRPAQQPAHAPAQPTPACRRTAHGPTSQVLDRPPARPPGATRPLTSDRKSVG